MPVKSFLLPALMLAAALPAFAGPPADDPLSGLPVAGLAQIVFTPGVPLLTEASRESLKPLLAKAKDLGCYWIAEGRNNGEAETLKAALAENDIAIETVTTTVTPHANSAEARLYCTPPERVTAYFLPGLSDLTEDARHMLTLAVASHWGTAAPLVVRGYAGAKESGDPLKLGLDRAQSARAFLIALGLSPKRLAIEANTQATGQDALRVEIMVRKS